MCSYCRPDGFWLDRVRHEPDPIPHGEGLKRIAAKALQKAGDKLRGGNDEAR